MFSPCLLLTGNTLYFCGYPSDNQDITYEHQKVSLSLLDGSAIYSGTSILENCHQVELVKVYAKSLDGFSGSPVFRVTNTELGHNLFEMVGVMIRGSIESGVAHFTDIGWILGCLDHYLDV